MRTALLSIWILLVLAACTKEDQPQHAEQRVTKKLELHVHAATEYTNAVYGDVTAAVMVTIFKINYLTGQSQKLWDTTITRREIATYLVLPQKVIIEKHYPVLESSEKLQVTYTVTYTTPAGTVQNVAAKECVPGEKSAFLDVSI